MTESIPPLPAVPRPPRGPRVGDVERAVTADALSAHFAAGRLDADELDVRLGAAMRARTATDLYALMVDLPRPPRAEAVRLAPPASRWTGTDVLVVLVLLAAALVSGVLLLALGSYDSLLFVGAVLGGLSAAVGGACVPYLVRRSKERGPHRPPNS